MFDQMSGHLWLGSFMLTHNIAHYTCQLEKLFPFLPGRHEQGRAVSEEPDRSLQCYTHGHLSPGETEVWRSRGFLPIADSRLDNSKAKNEYERVPETKNHTNGIETLKYVLDAT